MKIGIVCNFYIYNYGSVLQSYALQNFISQSDFEYEIVNYRDIADKKQNITMFFKLKIKDIFNLSKISAKFRMFKEMKSDEQYNLIISKRQKEYDIFVKSHFNLSKRCESIQDVRDLSSSYDIILLSSDQLWGPTDLIRDYHTLRQFPNNVKRVAYATSFGVAKLPSFLHDTVKDFIPKIDCVSVREKSGQKIIKDICNRDVPVVVDPTLLLKKEQWEEVFSSERLIKDRYVFCYFLGENLNYINSVKDFCRSKELKIVSILHPENYNIKKYRFADEYPDNIGPAEFLNLIYNAEYVLSDSFHASVFSIIFHKKFIVFDRYKTSKYQSRNTRIENLLTILDLESRHYINQKELSIFIDEDINWKEVDSALEKHKNKSIKYLLNSLKVQK